jgi:hypothetical protein
MNLRRCGVCLVVGLVFAVRGVGQETAPLPDHPPVPLADPGLPPVPPAAPEQTPPAPASPETLVTPVAPRSAPLSQAVPLLSIDNNRQLMPEAWSPSLGQLPFRIAYGITGYPEQPVRGEPTNLGFIRQDLRMGAPVWQNPVDEWSVSANVRSEIFHTNAILPFTGDAFPDTLWNVRLGTAYRHQFDNDWIGGLGVSFGSASNKPFEDINQLTVGANAFLRIPVRERDALILTLSYSNNTDFLNNIPIPGIAYYWEPNDWFHALFGFPFAHVWVRPLEHLTVDLDYRFLYTFQGRIAYEVAPHWRVYLGYAADNESYFLANNQFDDDRLFYAEQRVYTGVIANLGGRWTVDLSGGYAFDRSYAEGRSFQNRNLDRLTIEDGPYVSLTVHLRF